MISSYLSFKLETPHNSFYNLWKIVTLIHLLFILERKNSRIFHFYFIHQKTKSKFNAGNKFVEFVWQNKPIFLVMIKVINTNNNLSWWLWLLSLFFYEKIIAKNCSNKVHPSMEISRYTILVELDLNDMLSWVIQRSI